MSNEITIENIIVKSKKENKEVKCTKSCEFCKNKRVYRKVKGSNSWVEITINPRSKRVIDKKNGGKLVFEGNNCKQLGSECCLKANGVSHENIWESKM